MKIYDIFISYRRTDLNIAEGLYKYLVNVGYTVFWDKESLKNGKFGDDIKIAIDGCKNFILLVNDDTFDRCFEPEDWITKEVAEAIQKEKNIIPLFIGTKAYCPTGLPNAIQEIVQYNGIPNFKLQEEYIRLLFKKYLCDVDVFSSREDFLIRDGVLLKCNHQVLNVTIPDDVEEIAAEAFKNCTKIRELHFNNNLKRIGESAFYKCNSLELVEMSSQLSHISKRAFYRCQNLKSIDLSKSIVSIEEQAFAFCSKIRSIKLGECLTALDITAFEDCTLLEKIDIEPTNSMFMSDDGVLYDKTQKTLLKYPPARVPGGVFNVPEQVKVIEKYAFSNSQLAGIVFQGIIERIEKYAFMKSSITDLQYDGEIECVFVDGLAFKWCDTLIHNPFIMEKTSGDDNEKYIKERLILFEYVMVKTTFESEEEAYNMIKMLLERNLIASGQIKEHRAVYMWENEICDEREIELHCFTKGEYYSKVEQYILDNHSYECPEILCIPIINTSTSFGKWINDETEGKRKKQ